MNKEQIDELVEYNLNYFNEALTDEQIANSILDKAELTAKLEEKDKEIERLNKECDTYMKIATKRGNIIDELEKELLEKIEAIKTIKDMLGENAKVVNPHIEVLETEYNYFLDKLKALKEGK